MEEGTVEGAHGAVDGGAEHGLGGGGLHSLFPIKLIVWNLFSEVRCMLTGRSTGLWPGCFMSGEMGNFWRGAGREVAADVSCNLIGV